MPRLPTSLITKAGIAHPYAPLILRATRTLPSALLELRWLIQHVRSQHLSQPLAHRRLQKLVKDRSRSKPLQYLLGSEYFADLEIACRPGVLIPRWETAEAVQALVRRFTERWPEARDDVRILDLCTGTGCAALLARHEFLKRGFETKVLGLDIESRAVKLAKHNRSRLCASAERGHFDFALADVLAIDDALAGKTPSVLQVLRDRKQTQWDIVIANPPYVSPKTYSDGTTTRSVKMYEPKMALVPPDDGDYRLSESGDTFYPALLRIAKEVGAKALLMEVADLEQAERVACRILEGKGPTQVEVEIWRDEPVMDVIEHMVLEQRSVSVIGRGNGRSVVCWRDDP